MQYVIAYDLGTGGLKTGLFTLDGVSEGFEFVPYPTSFPQPQWHEQRPLDWWQAVCLATRKLIHAKGISPSDIQAIAVSGFSLVAAPIGHAGELLLDSVPIWSDRRAKGETMDFFSRVDYESWYQTTGNGDPPETYSVFKLMWMKKYQPEVFEKTAFVLGSKDFINYKFTGVAATDHSYASGCGVFDLHTLSYRDDFIAAAELSRQMFIEPGESHEFVGVVTGVAAGESGLNPGTQVFCGGVDNACMALGTTGMGNGRVYTSLGSSAWIAVSSRSPVLDVKKLPFVFAHVEKGVYTSGVSIFAAGSAFRWAQEVFCNDLSGGDVYEQMSKLAAQAAIGANGVLFNPSMAGGSSQEPSLSLQGGFFGLKLSTTRSDVLRSIMEGVALSLATTCLPIIAPWIDTGDPMVLCGGGAKSALWIQIFADVFNQEVAITNVDQDAASLGAAAIALRGVGFWKDYKPLDGLSKVLISYSPIDDHVKRYAHLAGQFKQWTRALAELHDNKQIENQKP
jgi:xylulokinase